MALQFERKECKRFAFTVDPVEPGTEFSTCTALSVKLNPIIDHFGIRQLFFSGRVQALDGTFISNANVQYDWNFKHDGGGQPDRTEIDLVSGTEDIKYDSMVTVTLTATIDLYAYTTSVLKGCPGTGIPDQIVLTQVWFFRAGCAHSDPQNDTGMQRPIVGIAQDPDIANKFLIENADDDDFPTTYPECGSNPANYLSTSYDLDKTHLWTIDSGVVVQSTNEDYGEIVLNHNTSYIITREATLDEFKDWVTPEDTGFAPASNQAWLWVGCCTSLDDQDCGTETDYKVYDLAGNLLFEGTADQGTSVDIVLPSEGVYIVSACSFDYVYIEYCDLIVCLAALVHRTLCLDDICCEECPEKDALVKLRFELNKLVATYGMLLVSIFSETINEEQVGIIDDCRRSKLEDIENFINKMKDIRDKCGPDCEDEIGVDLCESC